MTAYCSASVSRANGSSVSSAVADIGTGAGCAVGAAGARPSASAIRLRAQCASQAALSAATLSAARFWRAAWTRSSSDRAPPRLAHHAGGLGGPSQDTRDVGRMLLANRRQSITQALAGSRQATSAMAMLSRRAGRRPSR
jgi:hypothetical protein